MQPTAPRPRSVTVFGILNIVFAACGLLGTVSSAVMLAMQPDNPALKIMQGQPVYMAWTKISIPLVVALMAMLLTSGIGLLRMKAWARKLSLVYGVIAIVTGLCGLVLNYVYLVGPMLQEAARKQGPEAAGMMGGAAGGMIGGCVGLIYPILLLIFMTRPKVVQAFNASPAEMPPPA